MSEKVAMKNDMLKSLALLLMEKDSSLTLEHALNIVFNSNTYESVMNDKTHFYYQSPLYVFAFLEEEMNS